MVWPPRMLMLMPGVVTELEVDDANIVMERYSVKGVVAVDEYADADEALIGAREKRYAFLERAINNFREQNAIKKATQGDILMPRAHHRAWLKEMKQLKEELGSLSADAELLAPPSKPSESLADVAGAELKVFGISPDMAPLVPGMSDDFALGMTDTKDL